MVKKKMKKSLKKKGYGNYEKDSSHIKGKATDVLKPKNISEVIKLIKSNSSICIRGNGSGFVGGAVPQDEKVLDMRSMDNILELNQERKTLEVEAGITLEEINNYLLPRGFEFPVRTYNEGENTIGGLIARNDSGIRRFKYGVLAEWINWIEIVNFEGHIERKSRIDINDYLGMEGITGVIVKANLKVTPKIEGSADFFQFDSLEQVLIKVRDLRYNPSVCAIEMLDKTTSENMNLGFKYNLFVEYDSVEGKLIDLEYIEAFNLFSLSLNYFLNKEKEFFVEDFRVVFDKYHKIFGFLESYNIPMISSISYGRILCFFNKETEEKLQEIYTIVRKFGGNINSGLGIGLRRKKFVDYNDARLLINMKKRLDPANKFNKNKLIDFSPDNDRIDKRKNREYSSAREFLDNIDENNKVAILTHDDLDGIASGILIYEAVKKFAKKEIKFYTYNAQLPDFNFYDFDTLIISDLAPSFLKEVFENNKNKKILYIDHHQKDLEIPENVLEFRSETWNSCSRMAYEMFGGKQWLAVAGCIADAGDRYKENKEFISNFLEKENLTLEEYSTKYTYRFGNLLIYFLTEPYKSFELIRNLVSYKDITLVEGYILPVESEINELERRYKTEAEHFGRINFFVFDPKFGIKSAIINRLSYADEQGVFVFLVPLKETYRISYRNQTKEFDGVKLLKDCGVENAGGHKMACGGSINKEFLEQFKENLKNYNLENARI